MLKEFLFAGTKTFDGMFLKISSAIAGFFMPIRLLCLITFEFITIDFVIGVWASYTRAKKAGKAAEWGFESRKAWRTIWKFSFTVIGIVMCHHLDTYILSFVSLNLAKIFCGFVCGVELWSFLENAACISRSPIFMWLIKFMGAKLTEYAPPQTPTPEQLPESQPEETNTQN